MFLLTRINAMQLVARSLRMLSFQGGWSNSRNTAHDLTQEKVGMMKIRMNLMMKRRKMIRMKRRKTTKMMRRKMTKMIKMTRMTKMTKMTRTIKMMETMTKTRMVEMTTRKTTKLTLDLKDLLEDITRHGVHHVLGEPTQPAILTKSHHMLTKYSFLSPIHRRLLSTLLMPTAWEQCFQTKDQRF